LNEEKLFCELLVELDSILVELPTSDLEESNKKKSIMSKNVAINPMDAQFEILSLKDIFVLVYYRKLKNEYNILS
jgi:hypothetical protein